MSKALFISENTLLENSVITENISYTQIRPTIVKVQEMHIQPAVGSALYAELVTQVIAEATSEVLGIPIENIYSKSRLRPLVIARSIIADIAYSEFLFTYKNIAIELNRDHATIIHNLVTHVQDSRSTPQLKFLRTQVLHITRQNLQTSSHPYTSD